MSSTRGTTRPRGVPVKVQRGGSGSRGRPAHGASDREALALTQKGTQQPISSKM